MQLNLGTDKTALLLSRPGAQHVARRDGFLGV